MLVTSGLSYAIVPEGPPALRVLSSIIEYGMHGKFFGSHFINGWVGNKGTVRGNMSRSAIGWAGNPWAGTRLPQSSVPRGSGGK